MKVVLIFFLVAVSICRTKITLKRGIQEVVKFSGLELEILVKANNDGEECAVCLGSKEDSVSKNCSKGYAQTSYLLSSFLLDAMFTSNCRGELTCEFFTALSDKVQFSDDDSLNILVPETSNNCIVTLVNVKSVVKSVEAKILTTTVVSIVLVVCCFMFVILGFVFVVWFCFCRNPRTHQPVSTVAPEELPQVITYTTSRTPESQPRRRSSAVVKSHGMPSVIKRTSSSTTKPSNEKVNVPATMPLLTISAQVDPDVKKTVSVSKTTIVPTQVTAREKTSVTTSKTTIGEEKLPHVSPAPSQLPTTEATKVDFIAPIIDEVDNYRRISETYVCFGQRIKILGGNDHMRVTERINVEIQHFTSNAERKLLKAAATDAPKFADIVVMEARERISKHAASHYYRRIDWEENSSFCNYINDPSTPASVGYVVLYTLVPEIFKLKKQSLADELVRKMPISGLCIRVLDEKFPKNFRLDLAAELRRRASLIVPQVQMETLRESAFPVPYLAHACYKNGKSFVKGLEIHSKDPPKASKHK